MCASSRQAMTILRFLLSLFFVIAGAMHFLSPQAYMQIMPPFLPSPLFLIYLSGVCEIAGGIGVLLPRSRRIAGYGLIALLIAVFPANIYMAVNHLGVSGTPLPDWLLWLRLPLQAVLILWVWVCAIKSPTIRRAKTHTLKT
ncbi:MAG: DoxX family membrane protein [Acidobacteria bacterium]|nr:DoxX family membrane protein [Acidobacteriota bacterium]